MKRHHRAITRVSLVLAALILIAGIIVLLVPKERQPEYKGKPVSYWLGIGYTNPPNSVLEGYFDAFPPPGASIDYDQDFLFLEMNPEQFRAIQAIGTNAIPTLLRMQSAEDSRLKLDFVALAYKQHLVKFDFTPASNLNVWASHGFGALGARASNAVPALQKIIGGHNSLNSRLQAVYSLGWIGPPASNAVPALINIISDTNTQIRVSALSALGAIHARPDLVMPAIFEVAQHSDPSSQAQAVYVLKNYGAEARQAIHPYLGIISNLNPSLRPYAIGYLKKIDPDAAKNMPDPVMPDLWEKILNSDSPGP